MGYPNINNNAVNVTELAVNWEDNVPVFASTELTTSDESWGGTHCALGHCDHESENCSSYKLIRSRLSPLPFFGPGLTVFKLSACHSVGSNITHFSVTEDDKTYECTSSSDRFTAEKAEAFKALDRFEMSVRTMIDEGQSVEDLLEPLSFIGDLNDWMGRGIERCEADEDGALYCKRGTVLETHPSGSSIKAGTVEGPWFLKH
jgi:hypothetical protein